ncbi:MAG: DUF4402 domain-containing protein, partial [Pontixanthobacter sp.]
WRMLPAMLALIGLCAPPAHAARPQLRIVSEGELRFGSFAVMDSGYRIVGPNGGVQSSGIFSITSGDTGPARFTIQYDRGNNGRRRLNLRIQLVLSATPVVTEKGIVARLSSYRTDLPGAGAVQPGRIIELNIPNCTQRVCSKSFSLGARLDIERSFGGGQIEVPIPIDAVLISVK